MYSSSCLSYYMLAGDTVIFADTKEGMQNALIIFQSYGEIQKLEVNVNKTKVMIFSKGKTRQNYEFKLQNKALEIVDSYSYLELIFKDNGNFNEIRKKKQLTKPKNHSLVFIKVFEINIFRLAYSLSFSMPWLKQFSFTDQNNGVVKIQK